MSFSDATWRVGGVYDVCLASTEEGDMMSLMKCAIEGMDAKQKRSSVSLNTYLLILSGALVFFMQAGFAMLCAGSVRKKNTQNTMLKNLLDACGAAIAYFSVGYAFAFGGEESSDGTTTFIGTENFFGRGVTNMSFFFFQYTFAAAAVTIVAGALAERCKMEAYLCYSFFLTGFVYPVASHSMWSSAGFMSWSNSDPVFGVGCVDFAGGAVIHVTGGTTALIATYLLGSRRGRFYDLRTGNELEYPKNMPGHSVSLQVLGTFILWFGWFGFNAGSALLLTDNPERAHIGAQCAVNTFLSSSAGCILSLLIKMIKNKREEGTIIFDLQAAMNGTLTGLVAITAACATVEPWAALVVGAVAGVLYMWSSALMLRFKLDDVVDATPVHFVGGIWGTLSVGLLSSPAQLERLLGHANHPGFFYSLADGHSDARLLAAQVCGLLFIIGWTTFLMLPFFLILNSVGWLRTEAVEEIVGLDLLYSAMNGDMDDGSAQGVRDEYLMAYEEFRLKNTSRRNIGGSSTGGSRNQSKRSDARSVASSVQST